MCVYYTNLKPGNYVFHVQGSNSDGIWNEKGHQIEIRIIPPIWKTKAAFVFYLLVIIGIILYLNKLSAEKEKIVLQLENQAKLKELRTRFFMNVSHELKTPLTLISVPLKRIIENNQKHGTFSIPRRSWSYLQECKPFDAHYDPAFRL
jgi:signal transduction histidine kinase